MGGCWRRSRLGSGSPSCSIRAQRRHAGRCADVGRTLSAGSRLVVAEMSELERLRRENTALKAALSAAYDEAVDCHDNANPLQDFAAYLRYRLTMTTSHLYHVQTFTELQADVDAARQALWACWQHSGADTSGWDNPAHPAMEKLAEEAVASVKDLRQDYAEVGGR